MYFEILQARLRETLQRRLQNGEWTERRLAAAVGISQPHLHNLLKGIRNLTPELADRALRVLRMSLLDLLVPAELGSAAEPPRPTAGPSGVLDQIRNLRCRAQILAGGEAGVSVTGAPLRDRSEGPAERSGSN